MKPDPAPARHFLYPATLFAHQEEHLVTTVLGSCVAVCLWDGATGTGGMNHFMLPLWNGEGLATPKYGNVAIDRLLNRMLALGCRRDGLVAKIFGGATIMNSGQGMYSVGARNILLAQEQLAGHGIPVAGADVGGGSGRKILFNTRTGVILLGRCS
jgi:chemotaxis protein CheD